MSDKRKLPRTASLRRCGVVSPSFEAPCPARIINQSGYGLLLELDYPLPVDDVLIKIFLADELRGSINYEDQDAMVGMVRWCKQDMDSWSGFYQAGVELVSLKPRKGII